MFGRADGGLITGEGTSTSDSIIARLSNGEFVQKAKAVEYYGLEFMNDVNRLLYPRPADKPPLFSETQKFAAGGLVSSGAGSYRSTVSNLQSSLPAKFATGGLVDLKGPDIFLPDTLSGILDNRDNRDQTGSRNLGDSGRIINNNISLSQTIHAPRGLVPPKSLKQTQEHALKGMSRALKDNQ